MIRFLTCGLAFAFLIASGRPTLSAADCGCDATRKACGGCFCHHRHAGRNCQTCCQPQQPARELPREQLPPVGTIMETVPMARMMPIMAAPMMMTALPMQRTAYIEEAPRGRETTCETSSGRLAQLEQRFELLQQRVDSLQGTIGTQTDILVKIKAKLDELDQRVK